jgi:hypothetical protein
MADQVKPRQPRYVEFHTPEGKIKTLHLNGYNQIEIEPAPADCESLARRCDVLNDHYKGFLKSVHLSGDGMHIEADVEGCIVGDKRYVVIKPIDKK